MTYQSDLPARQRAFVACLISGLTQAEAAEVLGVKPRTCRRYYASPFVRAALAEAQDAAFGDTVRKMSATSGEAVDVLRVVMADTGMAGGVRTRAAQVLLDTAFRGRELLDLSERLARLEERIKNK